MQLPRYVNHNRAPLESQECTTAFTTDLHWSRRNAPHLSPQPKILQHTPFSSYSGGALLCGSQILVHSKRLTSRKTVACDRGSRSGVLVRYQHTCQLTQTGSIGFRRVITSTQLYHLTNNQLLFYTMVVWYNSDQLTQLMLSSLWHKATDIQPPPAIKCGIRWSSPLSFRGV